MVLDTHELAWAAGFFDGEGHTAQQHRNRKIGHSGRRAYTTIILDVRQIDRRVLDRFQKATGRGRVYGPYINKGLNRKPFWAYQCSDFEGVQAVVAMLWKWLGPVKRAQAKAALIAYRDRPRLKPGRKPQNP